MNVPENIDPFAAAVLQDSLRLVLERVQKLQALDVDHVVTERITHGDVIETLTIRWRRPNSSLSN